MEYIDGDSGEVKPVLVKNGMLASTKHRFTPEHILYGKLRPYLRKIACPDFDGVCSTDILPIRVGPELDRGYLFHYLRTPRIIALATTRSEGANLPRLSPGHLLESPFPVPSIPEQKRIATILDKTAAIRRKRLESLCLTDAFLRSVFLDMFGDPVMNLKKWREACCSSLFPDKPRIGTTRPASGIGYLLVRVGEIGAEEVDWARCGRVILSEEEFRKATICEGDILIARAIGSREQLGKASLFTGHSEPVVIDSHVVRLRPDPSQCDPYWFYFLVSSPQGKLLLQAKGGSDSCSVQHQCTAGISPEDSGSSNSSTTTLFGCSKRRTSCQNETGDPLCDA
jgi:type I restriction enzyme, S subunit